ncbi:MAG: tetratricopeptide repeat protein [Elusimicrobiota bacterium]
MKKNSTGEIFFKLSWLIFFFSLIFLADVKLARYKLTGMYLSIMLIFGGWIFFRFNRLKKIYSDTLLWPVISLFLLYTVFYLVSDNRPSAYGEWQRILFSLLAFITAYKTFPRDKKILEILVIMGGLIGLYGVLQRYGGVGYLKVPKMGRVHATFGNPNFFGSFLIGCIPLSGVLFLKNKKKIWLLASLVAMVTALYFTGTRGAWLGIMGALLLWYIVWGKNRVSKWPSVLIILGIIIFAFVSRNQWMRDTHRLLIWRDTVKMGLENPFTGVGIGEFHLEFPEYASGELRKVYPPGSFIVNYVHNEFLEIFAETGIVGLGLYLWFLVIFYIAVLKSTEPGDYISKSLLCGVTAILIHSTVSVNMRFAVSSIWVFTLMGIVSGWEREASEFSFSLNRIKAVTTLVILGLLVFWSQKVIRPLILKRRQDNKVSFFDTAREYSRQELREIIKRDSENPLAYYKLGWILAKEKKFKRAIKNFKKAVELDGTLTGAYNNMGNIYYTVGQQNRAIKYYKKALEQNPDLVDAHFNLGYIYYHRGRLKEAARKFEKVLKLDPDNNKARLMIDKMVQ